MPVTVLRDLRRPVVVATTVAAALAGGVATAAVVGPQAVPPKPAEVHYEIAPAADGGFNRDPFLADGVAVGEGVATYTAAGTGPAATNTAARPGTPDAYIDYSLLRRTHPDFRPTRAQRAAGVLPPGVSITYAQGLNAMNRVRANLANVGLTPRDLTFMRIYLDGPSGGPADYTGWNTAYRKYMANVDRGTGEVIEAYAPVVMRNVTRPARSNLEVASLPVAGWLVEIEVIGVFD